MTQHKNISHGHWVNGKPSPTYCTWTNMKQRCSNPNDIGFEHYKNVPICTRWLDSFENFLADMGERPKGTTLDRIDNTKGYEPSNCRWVNSVNQNRNRRTVKMTTENITKIKDLYAKGNISQRALAKMFGSSQSAICMALKKEY